ncbi:MAG: hypothetical protein JRJ19_11135, partial [Deltaproteobacteria bacterium]|nr:hypothetical protein [Deltaproteobacteria bacterium]
MIRKLLIILSVSLLILFIIPACSSGSGDNDAGLDGNSNDGDAGNNGDISDAEDGGVDAGDLVGDPGASDGGDTGADGGADSGADGGADTGADTGGDENTATKELTMWLFSSNNDGEVNFDPDTYPTFATGATVTLTPVPGQNNMFPFWLGFDRADVVDNGDDTYAITMNADKDLMAVFAEIAAIGVEQTGPVNKHGNILYRFDAVAGS